MCIRGLVVLLPMLFAIPGYAVDLSKIERKIRVEPEYTNQPRYCLLVFGPEADKRVWLVKDGKALHVDRNGNGVLDEPGERITGSGHGSYFAVERLLGSPDSLAINTLTVTFYTEGIRMRFYSGNQQTVGRSKRGLLRFSPSPATAPIVNFNGSLRLERYGEPVTLRPGKNSRGTRKESLRLMIGTPGLGAGTFAAIRSKYRLGEKDLLATFVYPSQVNGVKLLVEDVPLKYSS